MEDETPPINPLGEGLPAKPMEAGSQPFKIHLWGPPTLDWLNAAEPDDSRTEKTYYPLSRQAEGERIHSHVQLGGAALIEDLLKSMLPGFTGLPGSTGSNWQIELSGLDHIKQNYKEVKLPTGQKTDDQSCKSADSYHFYRHNYTHWRNFETQEGKPARYRMSEWTNREFGYYTLSPPQLDSLHRHIVVIDDPSWSDNPEHDSRSRLFSNVQAERKEMVKGLSAALINHREQIDQIVVRTASHNSPSGIDITQTAVVQMLKKLDADVLGKTTILTSLRDLRTESCRIEMSLSWEKMFYEVVDAVKDRFFTGKDASQIKVARVIVTVGLCGVIIVESAKPASASLVFEQRGQEGDFEQEHKGFVLGYTTCMLAALCAELVRYPDTARRDWLEASGHGLRLMRELHIHGYDLEKKEIVRRSRRYHLKFPCEFLKETYNEMVVKWDERILALRKRFDPTETTATLDPPVNLDTLIQSAIKNARSESGFGVVRNFNTELFKSPDERLRPPDEPRDLPADKWKRATTILIAKASDFKDVGEDKWNSRKQVFELAKQVVKDGSKKALIDVPVEIVKKWRSADRNEIEGIRSVKNAMRKYISDYQRSKSLKPVSVAIFGPPGAGKSFVVKQLAENLGIQANAFLSFNLSQYRSTDELAKAFHQIRDLLLRGELPVVFWDEFDSPLNNMPLGWLTSFLAPMQDGEFTEAGRVHPIGSGIHIFAGGTSPTFQKFCEGASESDRVAKKPDFISRLSAYVNVKGPNGDPNNIEDESYMIRRAFLLHSFLSQHAAHIAKACGVGPEKVSGFDVEDGVLNAFLRTSCYTNGSRSMEALVKSSDLRGKSKFELSSLPPDHILAMYVEADDFKRLAVEGNVALNSGSAYHAGTGEGGVDLVEGDAELNSKRTPLRERVGVYFDSPGNIGLLNRYQDQMNDKLKSPLNDKLESPVSFLVRLSNEEELALIEGLDGAMNSRPNASKLIVVLPVPRSYYQDTPSSLRHVLPVRLRMQYLFWINKAAEVIEMPSASTWQRACKNACEFIDLHSDSVVNK